MLFKYQQLKKKTHQKKSLSDEQNLWKKNLTHEQTY
jgi:hypothetical protein